MKDLISRQDALKAVSWDTEAYMAINMLPSIDAERKKGEWMYIDDDNWLYDTYKCTSCHRHITVEPRRVDDVGITIDDLDFCPNCGADMRGEQNDND